jgi:hypothetical protein
MYFARDVEDTRDKKQVLLNTGRPHFYNRLTGAAS